MAVFWHLVCFLAFSTYCVHSDTIESKTGERSESSGSHHLTYDSNIYPTQSLHNSNSNGYNSNQNPLSLSESNSAQIYGSGHQTNDELDKKERKTLILAIPVKLSLPNSQQDSYDQLVPQSSGESQLIQNPSLLYSKSSYPNSYSQLSRYPSFVSPDSDDTTVQKTATLPPLSQKIYSSIESQLKSASYSTVNPQKPVSEQPSTLSYTNEKKYKTAYETKDHKLPPNQYETDLNTYRTNPIREEYKSLNTEGVGSDYGSDRYKNPKTGHLSNKYVSDSYEDRLKQKETSKQVYDSLPENKPEYDYDSDSEDEDEEEDNKKPEEIYYDTRNHNNNKKGFLGLKNLSKNPFTHRKHAPKPNANPLFLKNLRENAQILPLFAAEPFDTQIWSQLIKSQMTGWPRIPDTIDNNLMSLLNGPKSLNGFPNIQTPYYAPAFDLMADSELKSASNVVPIKTLENSKIYGPAAKYQLSYPSLNLFSGFGQEFGGILDLNGNLYPAPLLGQTPPTKQHKPLQPYDMKDEQNPANRDSIKPHRRNPLLLRPNLMSGLRSVAGKPLANYSPFASASTTHSLLSSLPSLPSLQTSFNINPKSIPRQIFPLLYG